MDKISTFIGRLLMGQIFLLAGISKITQYAGTQGYMDAFGLPGAMLPLVILLEIGGGLALIVGWQTRWAAWALAAFTLVAGAVFHHNFADQTQMIMFMKNLAIAGGLLFVAAHGAGAFSIDQRRRTNRTTNTRDPQIAVG
ncbi:MAG: DoxX family protein [Gammaproteobacteria bacterium]|nr:DoxX family protein [Gammaproteobacteria bacterium]